MWEVLGFLGHLPEECGGYPEDRSVRALVYPTLSGSKVPNFLFLLKTGKRGSVPGDNLRRLGVDTEMVQARRLDTSDLLLGDTG